MKRFIVWLALAFFSAIVFALPTVQAVQDAVKAGRYEQAESMMREVVEAKPKSAKAHYVYAEILAHNGKRELAIQETRRARELDPALSFTDPEKFRSFEKALGVAKDSGAAVSAPKPAVVEPSPSVSAQVPAKPRPVAASPAPAEKPGLPGWVWGLGGAVILIMIWKVLSNRSQPVGGGGYSPGYQGPGMGGGQPSSGSGLLGMGLAGAGGFAAGMLAEKLLHGNDQPSSSGSSQGASASSGGSDQGYIPGHFDSSSSNELSDRSIDFGFGNDWGGDSSSSSSDGGGGGSDDW